MSIKDTRREYDYGQLNEASLLASPFDQFQLWLDQACQSPIKDPTAMTVSTLNSEGRPWHRAVLLKGFDEQGFVFYTNLGSNKARDIALNPRVSLHFPWFLLDRQVSVSGTAAAVSPAEVDTYFASRPRESQLAAWASDQSQPLASRADLEATFDAYAAQFADQDIPTPPFWGGFRITPLEFQFWQGGPRRLHDRFQYLPDTPVGGWRTCRLAP